MAYIYMAGGWVVRVPTSREAIENDLKSRPAGGLLSYEVDFPAGGARASEPVTVNAAQISLVTNQPLPATI